MKTKISGFFTLIFAMLLTVNLSASDTLYVDCTATGSNDGSSWTNAFTSLQSALSAAVSGDEIWVANGTYYPSVETGGTGSRYQAFHLISGVAIYGGFSGNETAVSQRTDFGNNGANETILSGDIGTPNDNSDNCYHVIYDVDPGAGNLSADATAILDGFTIAYGNANAGNFVDDCGGGFANHRGNPTLRNLVFRNNFAAYYGAGCFCYVSYSNVSNVLFIDNQATYDGGGIYTQYSNGMILSDLTFISNNANRYGSGMSNYYSSPIVYNAVFDSNISRLGGAMSCNNSSPTYINALFVNNQSSGGTAALTDGGAITSYSSNPTLINATIVNNSTIGNGGAINGSCVLKNCVIWGNTAALNGNQIYNTGTITMYASCYSNVAGDVYNTGTFTPDGACITSDPLLINASGNDFRLFGTSPAVNTGDNSYNTTLYDIRGEARIQNTTIDMGAYEWTAGLDPATTCENPTNGGSISDNQTICPNSVPSPLTSVSLPLNYFGGSIEYMWQSSTTGSSSGFSDISSSNTADYTPGSIAQTTWFKRLSRVDCKTDWSNAAESNVIQITTDSVMPAFSFATVYCQDDAELTLPASSDNGINGTWTPATIATTVPGSAEYTFTPDAGQCAKVVKTTVIINSKTTSTVTVSSCASYNWFGTDYTTSGSYIHVIANAAGCDSTITLNLTIFPDYSFIENQSICSGDTFTWRGNDYSIAGTYTDSYTSINGCDSIYTLNLTVNPTYAFSESETICNGDTLLWQGNNYTMAGTYTAAYTTINGCDSIYTLNLTVNPTYDFPESETICNGDTLIWQGNNYTAAGIYTASYTTINGCDSIYTLNLTVNPSYAFAENLSVCNGDTLQWQGNNYSVAGTYTAAYTTINGCDSIYTLNLTVNPVYAFTQDQAICNGDIYNWQGSDYSVAGTYTAAYTSITGCDSLYTLNLVVNTVDITVTENDPSISANLAGAVYQWLNCGNSFAPVAGETAQNFTATQNGNYAVMITEGLCTDTSECVTISTVGIENQAAAQIRLYPNPVTDKLVIEYPENDKNTAFIIQNVTGQIVFRGDLVEKTIVSTEELAPGTYVIRFENNTVMQFIKTAE